MASISDDCLRGGEPVVPSGPKKRCGGVLTSGGYTREMPPRGVNENVLIRPPKGSGVRRRSCRFQKRRQAAAVHGEAATSGNAEGAGPVESGGSVSAVPETHGRGHFYS